MALLLSGSVETQFR